jgi:hypothetical protein
LAGVGPFKGLSRELLTSLAVYVRPVRVGQGELLAVAGDKANALLIIQVSSLFGRHTALVAVELSRHAVKAVATTGSGGRQGECTADHSGELAVWQTYCASCC